jgi:hypothetical protein
LCARTSIFAATYVGVVDKNDVDSNIHKLLAERWREEPGGYLFFDPACKVALSVKMPLGDARAGHFTYNPVFRQVAGYWESDRVS